GFFGHGDMQKEFEEASFALKPGEISPIVETASRLHIIERYVPIIPVAALLFALTTRVLTTNPAHWTFRQFYAGTRNCKGLVG
ncbi:hypothetical protein LTR95_010002, partial [Oleoguttula sp. CCFEE 5521]